MQAAAFQKRLYQEIIDPKGAHHEFASGLHGQKIDFDKIADGSSLFDQWVQTISEKLLEVYAEHELQNAAFVSVANGTNRIVEPLARQFPGAMSYCSVKVAPKKVDIVPTVQNKIKSSRHDLAIVFEDTGTTGMTSAQVVQAVRECGVSRVEVLVSWQRRQSLEALEQISASYRALIHQELPTYQPDNCSFCAEGWQLVPYGAN